MRKKPSNPKRFRKIKSILSEYKKDSWNKFFKLTKSLVSRKTIAEVLESIFEKTIRLKVDKLIYTYGWDFSSSHWFTTTRDWPNWGGFVILWGLPLKSLICLLKTFIFICKLTLGSVTGILSKKSFQALQLYIRISLSSGVIFRDKLRTLIWFLNYIRWYETTSLKVFLDCDCTMRGAVS